MATIIVTGAVGSTGSWVVDHLATTGHEIVGLDTDGPSKPRGGVQFYEIDLTDQGETWELFFDHDPDIIVHLAAIPTPNHDPGSRVFKNNVETTYNVFEAAGRLDAEVIWTSSESAYGMVYAAEPWLPEYLPVDESHPLRPEDPYGTSKVVGEELASAITRRYDVPVTSIRPSMITHPGRYPGPEFRSSFDPETADLSANYWSYVDVRDVVSMIDTVIEADTSGHERYLCVADENYLGRDTAEVLEQVAGPLPEPCDLEGDQSALSNEKARDDFGWRPEHSYHEAESDPEQEPDFV